MAAGSTTIDETHAGDQPVDSDLSAIAALSTTSFGRSLLTLANAAALAAAHTHTVRTAAGVPTGAPASTEVPFAYDTTAVTGGFYYWSGAAWVKVATIL